MNMPRSVLAACIFIGLLGHWAISLLIVSSSQALRRPPWHHGTDEGMSKWMPVLVRAALVAQTAQLYSSTLREILSRIPLAVFIEPQAFVEFQRHVLTRTCVKSSHIKLSLDNFPRCSLTAVDEYPKDVSPRYPRDNNNSAL